MLPAFEVAEDAEEAGDGGTAGRWRFFRSSGMDWWRFDAVASSTPWLLAGGEPPSVDSVGTVVAVFARCRPFEDCGTSVVMPRYLLRNAVRTRKQSSRSQNDRNV
jgi:hypothetical protein